MTEIKRKSRRFLFRKPVGESERYWNQLPMGTTRGVLCELCGTNWPQLNHDEPGYTLGRFLGRQFVEECCGKLVDALYEDFGELFAMAFLEDFAKNPSDPKFGFLRFILPDRLRQAETKLEPISRETTKAIEQIIGINKVVPD